jgi:hypothetical protein
MVVLMLIFSNTFSQQYAFDALKYSFPFQVGTARYAAMGGALGALGSDISCIANNPAGTAMIRSTEFSISPAMFFNFTEADFDGAQYTEDKFIFSFGNIGAVYCRRYNKDKTTGVQFFNFGLAYQRTNNFNNNVFFNGVDSSYSLAQSFTDAAQGYDPGVLQGDFERLALNTGLIDTLGNTTTYENLGLTNNQVKWFSRQNLNSGSTGDILLSGALNYANKLFVGTSFGISILNYKRENNYSESDINNLSTKFHTLNFKETANASGLGVNVKVGVIYKPLDWFRVGFSFHTPTWHTITEDSYADLNASLNTGQFNSRSSTQTFTYNLTTPWRIQGSLGFLVFRKWAIGVEYEFADYTNMNLRPSSNLFLAENNYIDTVFSSAHIIRLGTELKLDPFKIRAGYNFQSDPYKKTPLLTNALHNISIGAGFKMVLGRNNKRERYLVFDLTYLLTHTTGQISNSNYATMPRYAQLQTGMHNIIGTVGFQF